MKVVDLLNKIANGEEVPEIIWIKGRMFEKYLNHNTYIDEEYNYFLDMTKYYENDKDFYNEEIIEEPKKIEPITMVLGFNGEAQCMKDQLNENIPISHSEEAIIFKLNEIIDYINGDKDDTKKL